MVLGIAYKKNVDDMRESPSVELMSILKNKGAIVTYSDPYVPQFPKMRKYSFDLDSVELTPEVLQQADCVLIAINHDDFDYEMIKANPKIIVDTRGVYREPADHIVRA
ncbi:MAG: UDP binding domain-containing protein [Acidobacteriota bacterium]|nr:UDP binding domain-containing protein [Acidobacteriota bacterium]